MCGLSAAHHNSYHTKHTTTETTTGMGRFLDFLLVSFDSSPTTMARKGDVYLPMYTDTRPRTKFKVKALLGHCLYRRVVIWAIIVFAFLALLLVDSHIPTSSRNVLDIVHGSKGLAKDNSDYAQHVLLHPQASIDSDLPGLEVHEPEPDFKVDVVDDTTESVPGDISNSNPSDASHETQNDIPESFSHEVTIDAPADTLIDTSIGAPIDEPIDEMPDDNPNDNLEDDDMVEQEENAGQQGEHANGNKWLDYKQ